MLREGRTRNHGPGQEGAEHQEPLDRDGLKVGIDPRHREPVTHPGQMGRDQDAGVLELEDAVAGEDDGQGEEEQPGELEERAQRQSHAGRPDEHGDGRQDRQSHDEADGQAEESGPGLPLAAEQGLVHQRGLGSLAIDGQERRDGQSAPTAPFQPAPGLVLEEVHPPLGFRLRDQPVTDVEQHTRGDEHHQPLEDLARPALHRGDQEVQGRGGRQAGDDGHRHAPPDRTQGSRRAWVSSRLGPCWRSSSCPRAWPW